MENFDNWNILKKEISKRIEPKKYPQEGEVWLGSIGQNIGYEQSSNSEDFSRPFLVIKKFNNQMFWIIPLSTKQKKYDFYFNYLDHEKRPVSAILAQMKLVSIKRFQRKMHELSPETLDKIKSKITLLIK